MAKYDKILKIQTELNRSLAQVFRENGIKNFRLISLGNSIGSGYSMSRITKPLLLRNETIESVMGKNDIKIDRHHFARAQNNNDEHLFEWIAENIKESSIHRLNRNDYNNGPTSMPTNGLTEEKIDEYFPVEMENDIGLQDAILESNDSLANIVVYNGCTGSFLDNVTRKGKLSQKLTYGINRDTYGLEATLKFIQSNNRKNNSNTQVYICGVPDFLGLKISEVINIKLKKIAKKYSNAVYVKPVKSKFLYKPFNETEEMDLEQAQSIFKKFFLQPDVHYDEEEYLKFNNNIIKSIKDNYLIIRSMINVDRKLYGFSDYLEIDNNQQLNNKEYIQQVINEILINESSQFKDEFSLKKFYDNIKKYLIERFPYDFYYIGKQNINESLNNLNRKK